MANVSSIDEKILKCKQELMTLREARARREREVHTLESRLADAKKHLAHQQQRVNHSLYTTIIKGVYKGDNDEVTPAYILNKQALLCHNLYQTYEVMGGQKEQIESATDRLSTYLKAELHRIQDERPLREVQILNAIASSSHVKTKLQKGYEQLLTRQEQNMSKSRNLQTPPSQMKVENNKASTKTTAKQRSVARRPLRKGNARGNARARRVVPRST
jgi:hypothetical protein